MDLGGDYSIQGKICTLKEFLELADKPDGRILNALNFPLSLAGVSPSPFSSEVEAYLATKGRPFCKDEDRYPTSDNFWGLAAHEGARHWSHIDAGGTCTKFKIKDGGKYFIVARNKIPNDPQSRPNHAHLTSNHAFTGHFAVDEPNSAVWDYEAFYLLPGDEL